MSDSRTCDETFRSEECACPECSGEFNETLLSIVLYMLGVPDGKSCDSDSCGWSCGESCGESCYNGNWDDPNLAYCDSDDDEDSDRAVVYHPKDYNPFYAEWLRAKTPPQKGFMKNCAHYTQAQGLGCAKFLPWNGHPAPVRRTGLGATLQEMADNPVNNRNISAKKLRRAEIARTRENVVVVNNRKMRGSSSRFPDDDNRKFPKSVFARDNKSRRRLRGLAREERIRWSRGEYDGLDDPCAVNVKRSTRW